MAKQKLTTVEFIKTLKSLDRGFFTMADLEKITGMERNSLKVTLNRLVKQKLLVRLKRGVYQLEMVYANTRKIANQLYYPSYLSFESALSVYGILSQIPFTQTFATTKKSKKMIIGDTEAEFTQLKSELFFGYKLEKDGYIAEPEKALLDQLYLISRGKRSIDIKELDLKEIDVKKLDEFAKAFPPYINQLLNETKKYIGSTPVTNENNDRIWWKKTEKNDPISNS